MAENPDLSPLPFRRERNLSNRNFNKRSSRNRFSAESHSSVHEMHLQIVQNSDPTHGDNGGCDSSSTLTPLSPLSPVSPVPPTSPTSPISPASAASLESPSATSRDPALLDVRQKVERFETLKHLISYKKPERLSLQLLQQQRLKSSANPELDKRVSSASITEELEADVQVELEVQPNNVTPPETIYILAEQAKELDEHRAPSPVPGYPACRGNTDEEIRADVEELSLNDFTTVETVRRSTSAEQQYGDSISLSGVSLERNAKKDFPRNFRTAPRRKTEIICTSNRFAIDKCHSLYKPSDEDDEEIVLRDKSDKCVLPILEELINTEEAYVENLRKGIDNYGNIFQRKDLPIGLRGKRYELFGNIEAIYEFHRDEFLPMLHRNQRDLKRLFDEFQNFITTNAFYAYVIFTINKQKSLKLCDIYKNYFKLIQAELNDKLGINSFLVQPIQRMARYPLLLTQFINTFFKNRDIVMKPLIESCCRLEKRLRTLLTTTNESEVINDIVHCNEFNVFYQGKFRKVSEFQVIDQTLKRSYRSKVFIFDKCIIYTEIKGKCLIFHGRYPCEHIGISAKTKSFTLFYERRRQQECDFLGEPALITQWLDLIRDMITSFAQEERRKLQERYSRENDHMHRKTLTLSLYRDSNRFSSDSGIGNIWSMPKPEEEQISNRTTWYTNG